MRSKTDKEEVVSGESQEVGPGVLTNQSDSTASANGGEGTPDGTTGGNRREKWTHLGTQSGPTRAIV